MAISLAVALTVTKPVLSDPAAPAGLSDGRWGTTPTCTDGRIVTFQDGWMRGDPAPPKGGGPVEYLPLKLKLDRFEKLDRGYRLHTASGETLKLISAPGGDLTVHPEKVRQGSICSAIAADAHLYRCPPAESRQGS